MVNMFQEWIDERLQWEPTDYSGLHTLRVPCDKLWLPDMVLYNRYYVNQSLIFIDPYKILFDMFVLLYTLITQL